MKLIKYLWNNGTKIGATFLFTCGAAVYYFSNSMQFKQLGLVLLITSLYIKLDAILEEIKNITIINNFINRDSKIKITTDSEAKTYNELLDEIAELKKERD